MACENVFVFQIENIGTRSEKGSPPLEYTDRTWSVRDDMARQRTGHPPSQAEAKKMKSLTLHTREVMTGVKGRGTK